MNLEILQAPPMSRGVIFILVAALLAPHAGKGGVDDGPVPGIPELSCTLPATGTPKGSCDALANADGHLPSHVGDIWIECEEKSGRHGYGGYGEALFFTEEVEPYWDAEIEAYLEILKFRLSSKQLLSIQTQQVAWETGKLLAAKKVARKYANMKGTAYMYLRALESAGIPRRRALTLGCMVEKVARRNSPPPDMA